MLFKHQMDYIVIYLVILLKYYLFTKISAKMFKQIHWIVHKEEFVH